MPKLEKDKRFSSGSQMARVSGGKQVKRGAISEGCHVRESLMRWHALSGSETLRWGQMTC